jgi:hypothetical protein
LLSFVIKDFLSKFDYNNHMQLWIGLTLLLQSLATSPTPVTIKVSLGEAIEPGLFMVEDPPLTDWLNGIDTNMLATHEYSRTIANVPYTWKVVVTIEGSQLEPLVGSIPFIASFAENLGLRMIEIFNPKNEEIILTEYALIINETAFLFEEDLRLPAMTSLVVPIETGQSPTTRLGLNQPLIYPNPIETIHLWEAERTIYIDSIALFEIMDTRYGEVTLQDYYFRRHPKIIAPEVTYTASSWVPVINDVPFETHQLWTPTVTALDQAKAWATYVMFGAGMFAAGRVEEAFRALEAEYQYMDPASQLLLFTAPNTAITGINERGNLDRSSFREAVGRYNYLAARVPGASGLINPNPVGFPVTTILIIAGSLLGLFGIFAYLKSRYAKL